MKNGYYYGPSKQRRFNKLVAFLSQKKTTKENKPTIAKIYK